MEFYEMISAGQHPPRPAPGARLPAPAMIALRELAALVNETGQGVLVTEHGLGLAVHTRGLGNAAAILSGLYYREAVAGIKKFNKINSMENKIGNLIELYDTVVSGRSKTQ